MHGSTEVFDVDRYLGKWYEVAHLPTYYQKGCGNSVATYEKFADGTISVFNECFNGCGKFKTAIQGYALVKGPGQLEVRFPEITNSKWLNKIINKFQGCGTNYIVHDTDYTSYAIVGSPNRKSLWFLSRSRHVTKEQFLTMKDKAHKFGYCTKKLVIDRGVIDPMTDEEIIEFIKMLRSF